MSIIVDSLSYSLTHVLLVGIYADCTYKSESLTFKIDVKDRANSAGTDIFLYPDLSMNKYVLAEDYVVSSTPPIVCCHKLYSDE